MWSLKLGTPAIGGPRSVKRSVLSLAVPSAFEGEDGDVRGVDAVEFVADQLQAHDGPHIFGEKDLFMRIAALEEPDAVEVLGGRAAHVHRVFGEVHVAVGRDAQGGRRLDVGGLEDDFTLETVGHFRQGFVGEERRGEREEAGGREEREAAGCHGEPFHGRWG